MGDDNLITKEARNLVKTCVCLHFFHITNDEIVFVSTRNCGGQSKNRFKDRLDDLMEGSSPGSY